VLATLFTRTDSPGPGQKSKASKYKYKSKYKKLKSSSKKVQKPRLIKVLLDSGSDGDLLFHKKEHPNTSPTWLGRWQKLGASQMETSTQKEEVTLG
jgi:formate-dependent phosphoribosylglycinamide formyltransferase (GAR transformylase)